MGGGPEKPTFQAPVKWFTLMFLTRVWREWRSCRSWSAWRPWCWGRPPAPWRSEGCRCSSSTSGRALRSYPAVRHKDVSPPGSRSREQRWAAAFIFYFSFYSVSYASGGAVPDVVAGVSAAVAGVVCREAGARLGAVATRWWTRKENNQVRSDIKGEPGLLKALNVKISR